MNEEKLTSGQMTDWVNDLDKLNARVAELEDELKAQISTPMQPIVEVNGVHRFKSNPIVRYLSDTNPEADMNQLCIMFDDEPEALSQFAQLIGYSVSGAADLDYVSDETLDRAEKACAELERLKESKA